MALLTLLALPLVGCGGAKKTEQPDEQPPAAGTPIKTVAEVQPTDEPTKVAPRPRADRGELFEGKTACEWIALITDRIEGETARDMLREMGPDAMAPLLECLKNDDAETRRNALAVLRDRRDRQAPQVVTAIRAILSDPDDSVRSVAVKVLREIGPAAKSSVLELTKILDRPEEHWHIQHEVLLYFGELGRDAAGATAAVGRVLRSHPKRFARDKALKTLEKIGLYQEGAVQALAEALKDDDVGIRLAVLESLETLGPGAKTAAEALVGAFSDPEMDVRLRASKVLESIGAPAVPALIGALDSTHNNTRHYTLYTLAHIGPPAKKALGPLQPLLNHENKTTRTMAGKAISAIRGDL